MVRGWVRRQIKELSPEGSTNAGLVHHLNRLNLPRHWQFWGTWGMVAAAATGAIAVTMLLRQPSVPNDCEHVFWPFASASFRLYCSQVAAERPTPEGLIEAIYLINPLPKDHPLRPEVDRRIETWSTQVLRLTEATFQAGQLEEAIKFVKQIPSQTTAYPLVQSRIARWQRIWAKGADIYQRAETALQEQNWRRAFNISLGLMEVDNRYWAVMQFERLNRRIIAAQLDDSKLGRARRYLRWGGLENLLTALTMARQISPNSDFQPTAQRLIDEIGTELLSLAENALKRQDLQLALEAAQNVPQEASAWPDAQDLVELAYAESWTWEDSIAGLEAAIAHARRLKPSRPLYGRAQELIQQWQADIQAVRILQQAKQLAQGGTIASLSAALTEAQKIPATMSDFRRRLSQQQIQTWTIELQTLQDQPLLDQAEQLAATGQLADLQAAIALVQQISSDRPLYDQASARIQRWNEEVQTLTNPVQTLPAGDSESPVWLTQALSFASQGTPEGLARAIGIANQVATDSPERAEADRSILQWSGEILNQARVAAITNLSQAIAIAQQVPTFSPTYPEAQALIQEWKGRL